MLKHVWSIMAAKSVVDSDTQMLSIYDISDTLNIQGKKSDLVGGNGDKNPEIINVPLPFEVVSMFYQPERKTETANLRLILIDPTGKELAQHDQEIVAEKYFLRTRIKINGMGVTKTGIYKIQVFFKEKESKDFHLVAEVPYVVNIDLK